MRDAAQLGQKAVLDKYFRDSVNFDGIRLLLAQLILKN